MDDRRIRDLRLIGAALLVVGGSVHTWLAFDGYGPSDLQRTFFLNGAGSALVAAAIALRRGPIAPLAGVGVSAASLFAFALSRGGDGVVGFRATGLDPTPEAALTLLVEVAALVALGAVAVSERRRFTTTVGQPPAAAEPPPPPRG